MSGACTWTARSGAELLVSERNRLRFCLTCRANVCTEICVRFDASTSLFVHACVCHCSLEVCLLSGHTHTHTCCPLYICCLHLHCEHITHAPANTPGQSRGNRLANAVSLFATNISCLHRGMRDCVSSCRSRERERERAPPLKGNTLITIGGVCECV